ncbi:MAG TPA: RNA polymerase subunit sigma [Xanthomonadaceae bacterium]|nr:RNA polymerase subunit sigma [Xanthomonadaceae bacterium]
MSVAEAATHHSVNALYDAHHGWLCGWLLRRLGNASDAADLAQDTFVSVLVGGQAGAIREPRPFLATVAGRLVAHRYRRRALEQAYLDALAALPEELAPSPEARLLALEVLQELDRVLQGMPSRVRKVFLLAHLEALSYREIAERLRISASSVKQHLTRANRQCLFALTA